MRYARVRDRRLIGIVGSERSTGPLKFGGVELDCHRWLRRRSVGPNGSHRRVQLHHGGRRQAGAILRLPDGSAKQLLPRTSRNLPSAANPVAAGRLMHALAKWEAAEPRPVLLRLARTLMPDHRAVMLLLTGRDRTQPMDDAVCRALHRAGLVDCLAPFGWYATVEGFCLADAVRWQDRQTRDHAPVEATLAAKPKVRRNAAIAEARANGVKLSDIAGRHNISLRRAHLIAKAGGVKNVQKTWTDHQKAQLRWMWAEGKSGGVIGREIGFSRSAVNAQARRLGLAARTSVRLWTPETPSAHLVEAAA